MLLLTAALLASTASPAPAQTASFKRCGILKLAICGKVDVPLDRSGRTPGTVRLHVRRVPTPGASRGALFTLAGGPGQAATPFAEYEAFQLGRGLDGREVVTFDQRGTGRSGTLRCPTLEGLGERLVNVAGAAADCAETIGPRRAFYTTRDSVEDLEAVRRAIGVDKVILYGVSYGTKLALAYAAAYPAHVERLLLDSSSAPTALIPLDGTPSARWRACWAHLCDRRCKAFTQDPAADLSALVSRMGSGLLRGPVVRDDGAIQPARLGRIRLMDLLFAGDFDPRCARPSRRLSAPPERRPRSDPAVGACGRPRRQRPGLLLQPRRVCHDHLRGGAAAVAAARPPPRGWTMPGRCWPRPRTRSSARSTASRCSPPRRSCSSAGCGPPRPPTLRSTMGRSWWCRRWCSRARTIFGLRSRPRVRSRRGCRTHRCWPSPTPGTAHSTGPRADAPGPRPATSCSASRARAACASRDSRRSTR